MKVTYAQAIARAMDHAMAADPDVFLFGIGADDHKEIFGSARGLRAKYGPKRVFDTPIAEGAMTGVAIGAALAGLKPVHVHIRADFLYLALDQLLNQAAKWRYMFGGKGHVPITVRAVIGRSWGQGAQHSQSLQSFFMHVPGIKVAMPTTPADAQGLLLSAIADPNPVVLIEHRLLYYIDGEVPDVPEPIPFGRAAIRREGSDVTIVATSYMVAEALQAATFLAERGIEVEIIDPRSLVPLDRVTILESLRRTRRLLVVDTSWETCGVGAEIAAIVAETCPEILLGPVRRLGSAPSTCPVSRPLEEAFYPNASRIASNVFAMVGRAWKNEDVPMLKTPFKGPF